MNLKIVTFIKENGIMYHPSNHQGNLPQEYEYFLDFLQENIPGCICGTEKEIKRFAKKVFKQIQKNK